jgi:hypothetical protein
MRASTDSDERSTAHTCLERLTKIFQFQSVDQCIAAHATFVVDKVSISARALASSIWPRECGVLNELLISMINCQRLNREAFNMPVFDSILNLLFIFVDFGNIRGDFDKAGSFQGLLVFIELLQVYNIEILKKCASSYVTKKAEADILCDTFEICDYTDARKDPNSFCPIRLTDTDSYKVGFESALDNSSVDSDEANGCAERVNRALEDIVDRLLVALGGMGAGVRAIGVIGQVSDSPSNAVLDCLHAQLT